MIAFPGLSPLLTPASLGGFRGVCFYLLFCLKRTKERLLILVKVRIPVL